METKHTPGQSQETLARIKGLLAHIDALCEADQSQPVKRLLGPYTARACLTEPNLAAWEAEQGVSLPEAHRLFLLEIGNGGEMPGSYCDWKMWQLDSCPWNMDIRLREPFPVSKDRFEQRMARLKIEERGHDSLFPVDTLPTLLYSGISGVLRSALVYANG